MVAKNEGSRQRIAIEMEKDKDGATVVFIAIHDADVDLRFANGERVSLYRASLDLYLGGIKPDVYANVYAMDEKP